LAIKEASKKRLKINCKTWNQIIYKKLRVGIGENLRWTKYCSRCNAYNCRDIYRHQPTPYRSGQIKIFRLCQWGHRASILTLDHYNFWNCS